MEQLLGCERFSTICVTYVLNLDRRQPMEIATPLGPHLRPQLPIQRPELNRFRNVVATDSLTIGQVGYRPRDFQHAVVCSRTELQVGHGELHQLKGGLIQRAESLNLAAAHPGVAADFGLVLESVPLTLTRCNHSASNVR